MLHDLANDGGYVALKWAAAEREHGQGMSKACSTSDDAVTWLQQC